MSFYNLKSRLFTVLVSAGISSLAIADEPGELLPPPDTQSPTVCNCQERCANDACCSQHRPNFLSRYWHGTIRPHMKATHWGYDRHFCAPPLGNAVAYHMRTHVANGQAASLVLYHYDFQNIPGQDPTELNPTGRRRLHKMMSLLAVSPLPLLIQMSDDNAQLNSDRRRNVQEFLGRYAPELDLGDRVVVADPLTPGTPGEEALIRHQNLQNQNTNAPAGGYLGTPRGGFTIGGG